MKITIKILLFASLFMLLSNSCEKDKYMKAAYVNFYIYLNQAQYSPLHAVNNAMIIDDKVVYNGVNYSPCGIIVYRFSDTEFKAYDARCSFNYEQNHQLELFDSYKARCPECGSEFELNYGTTIKGPASYPLLEYRTRLEGNTLYVTN